MIRISALTALALLTAPVAHADAVSDALAAAQSAYEGGDLSMTSAQLITAQKAVAEMQSGLLMALMPAAPEGWTRSENTDLTAGLGMMGGGAGAEVYYDAPDGVRVTISAYADNVMVSSMAGLLGNPAMMAMMGKVTDVNGTPFLNQEGSFSSLLANRVLIQVNGGSEEQILALLTQIDLAKMAVFDKR